MRPWIWPGGMLGVQYCSVSDLRIGEIAVWFDGRRLKSHRVVAFDGSGGVITRSDLGDRNDAPASNDQLVGRAITFEIWGIKYRLDGGLPAAAGQFVARAPWLGAAYVRTFVPARRWLGRVVDRAYTAGPVRAMRRRRASQDWTFVVQRSPREVRISASRGSDELGQARLGATFDLDELWVARRMRGLGLGRALLRRALDEAKKSGASAVRYRNRADGRLARLLRTSGFRRGVSDWVYDVSPCPVGRANDR